MTLDQYVYVCDQGPSRELVFPLKLYTHILHLNKECQTDIGSIHNCQIWTPLEGGLGSQSQSELECIWEWERILVHIWYKNPLSFSNPLQLTLAKCYCCTYTYGTSILFHPQSQSNSPSVISTVAHTRMIQGSSLILSMYFGSIHSYSITPTFIFFQVTHNVGSNVSLSAQQ